MSLRDPLPLQWLSPLPEQIGDVMKEIWIIQRELRIGGRDHQQMLPSLQWELRRLLRSAAFDAGLDVKGLGDG